MRVPWLVVAAAWSAAWLALAGYCVATSPTYRRSRLAWRNRRTLRRAVRRHPANRPPFDWARDPGCVWVRQPSHVHRKVS